MPDRPGPVPPPPATGPPGPVPGGTPSPAPPPPRLQGRWVAHLERGPLTVTAWAGRELRPFIVDHNAEGEIEPLLAMLKGDPLSLAARGPWPRGGRLTLSYIGRRRNSHADTVITVGDRIWLNTASIDGAQPIILDHWSDGSARALRVTDPETVQFGQTPGFAGAAPHYTLDVAPIVKAHHAGFAWSVGGPFVPADTMERYRQALDLFAPWQHVHDPIDSDGAHRVIDRVMAMAARVRETEAKVAACRRQPVPTPSWTTGSIGASAPVPAAEGAPVDGRLGALGRGERLDLPPEPIVQVVETGSLITFKFVLLVCPTPEALMQFRHDLKPRGSA